jgi:hypothetical protein
MLRGRQRSLAMAGWAAGLAASLVLAAAQGVVLNEVMPADASVLADEDGDYPGWVELYNAGPAAVNLGGYGLSDDPSQLYKWIFPSVDLAPGDYLVVFTSGKNRQQLWEEAEPAPGSPPAKAPDALPGLLFWLDAADANTVGLVEGQVGRWRDKSGRELKSEPMRPDQLAGLRLWLDAADTNTLSAEDGRVAVWAEKSGNTNHAWQADPTRQPLHVPAAANGLPMLRFDGVDDYLRIPRITTARSVFWVAQENPEASDDFRPVLGDATFYDFHRGSRFAIYWDDVTAPVQQASAQAWLNGREVNPFKTPLPKALALVSTLVNSDLRVGAIGTDRLLTNRFWHGEVGEVIVFGRELPTVERMGVEEYLLRKWQIAPPPVVDNYDAVQTEPKLRPAYGHDALSGLPGIQFDGLDDFLAFPRISEIRTLFWVGREAPEATDSYRPLLGDSGCYDFHRGDDRVIYSWYSASEGVIEGRTWLNGEPIDPLTTRAPKTRAMLATVTTTNCSASTVSSDRLLDDRCWAGDISEIILYDRALSDDERLGVERYLARKWRLPVRYLHTSFSLEAGGQWLLLTAGDGRPVSQLSLASLRSDLSLGCSLAAEPAWAYFAQPTPGQANTTPASAGIVPDPVLTPTGGFFTNGLSLAMFTNELAGQIYYTLDATEPSAPLAQPVDVVWVDDALPSGAMAAQDQDVWQWVSSWPTPYAGKLAHQSALVTGVHQHYFLGAAEPLAVHAGDSLIAYVYVDPLYSPVEVMLQWYAGDWEHRAYWGADKINLGAAGTPGRVYMGPLPPAGQWVRLEVPAWRLGLEEKSVTGVAFALYDGRGTWDCLGKATARPGTSTLYTGPLALSANTVVRARAFRPGWVPSRIVTESYLVNPASTLPVISLVSSPDNFFSDDHGLLALGPGAKAMRPNFGANFWRDWERPVHVEFYEADGRRGFSLEAGARVHGGWTRCWPQKSMRLYARRRYGAGAIRYQVFPNLPLDRFENLVLRNAGNDWTETLMRDVLGQSLVDGIDLDHQASRPARAYINGQYWGIYHVQERIDEHYLAAHHQIDPQAVDIVENEFSARVGNVNAYLALRNLAATNNLATPENYQLITQQMDVGNYADYMVAQIYGGNTDWPGNNEQCWRAQAPGAKWRWLLYDLDGWFDVQREGANSNKLAATTASSLLLGSLLNNAQFQQQFVNRFADHLNSTFAPERVLRRIAEMQAELAPEIPLHIARWAKEGASCGAFADVPTWNANVDVLRAFATQRPQFVRQHITECFNLGGAAQLTLGATNAFGGRLCINTLTLAETNLPWTGTYFQGVPVTVTAIPKATCRFIGWAGTDQTNASLTLTLTNDLTLTALFQTEEEFNYANLRPRPFDLGAADYGLDAFAPDTPAGTYPPSMIFLQTSTRDPSLAAEMDSEWTLPYNLTSRSCIRGLGEYGFSFINTSETQDGDAGYLGAALLALHTIGARDIQVTWTGGTVNPNSRVYAIRLQYRLGTEGPFADVLDEAGLPVEYGRSDIVGDFQTLGPVTLPAAASNRLVVQLRWKYYFIPTGATGPRAELRVDDIRVTASRPAPGLHGFSRSSDNVLLSDYTGSPGRSFTVWASTNLVDWLPLQTLNFDGEGKARLEQPIRPDTPACFFQLRSP